MLFRNLRRVAEREFCGAGKVALHRERVWDNGADFGKGAGNCGTDLELKARKKDE
jgi:hypothetical protein